MSGVPRIGPTSGPFEEPSEGPDQDATVAALRGALFREAQRVAPSQDGLQRIQREIRTSQGRRRGVAWIGRLTPMLATAAAVAVLAVAGAVAVRLNRVESTGGSVPAASISATAEASADKLPVYVIGRQGGRQWLYREFRPTHARIDDDRVAEAVTTAVNLTALDPDYDVRLFQGGGPGQATATVNPSLITVTLTAAMVSRSGLSQADAELAVQQVVWTATATAGSGYATTPVRIQVAGGRQLLFGRLPLGGTFTRATGPQDPRAPIWVISLADQTDVGHLPLTVRGDAVVGEGGRVTWTLTRDGAAVGNGEAALTARSGSRTGWELSPGATQPGTYVLTVTLRPGSGTGLPTTVRYRDTRTFYVR